jgi:Fe-S cluster assembly protein SufD
LAETQIHPQTSGFIESIAHPWWTVLQRLQALDHARLAAVPSRLEEDWRKTDPDLFPWARVEQVAAGRTTGTLSLRMASGGPVRGIQLADEETAGEHCRTLQMISGDDYDAKFLYYHKALCRQPVGFRVPTGWKGDALELLQSVAGPGLGTFTTIIIVEAGAELTLLDRWELPADTLAVGRTEIRVEAGAKLNYIQEDVCGARVSLYRRARIQAERDAEINWYSFTRGAAWHAARMEMALNGSGSRGLLKGLFAGNGDARADHRTHQYHAAPRAKSDLTFKTLLSGRAHSVYQGLISVPKQSQKTDAYQQCRNLLLEAGTHADAIPKLEIIADDVRCTHGASMGSLNKDQLFYMMSRGLSRAQALRTIATGFAEEIIAQVPVETIQERWRTLTAESIGESAS